MHGFLLREETPTDYPEIRSLVKTAFETAKVKAGDEQDFVDRLRAGGTYIPELALVAVESGRLVGHIMLTHQPLKTDRQRAVRALLLAPLSVLLEHRSQGIGAALVREALRRAGEMRFDGIFLAGDPAYYFRFGFKPAAAYGVVYNGPIPAANLLAVELRPGAFHAHEVELAGH